MTQNEAFLKWNRMYLRCIAAQHWRSLCWSFSLVRKLTYSLNHQLNVVKHKNCSKNRNFQTIFFVFSPKFMENSLGSIFGPVLGILSFLLISCAATTRSSEGWSGEATWRREPPLSCVSSPYIVEKLDTIPAGKKKPPAKTAERIRMKPTSFNADFHGFSWEELPKV